jgi:putative restriction endonuclease
MPARSGTNWTRKEHILAFNLYCQIPFGTIHMRNPKIIELARLLRRSVGSVSYKLSNFARLDPSLQARGIKGSQHGAKGEAEVWQEFADDPEELAFESEQLLANRLGKPLEEVSEISVRDLPREGIERAALIRIRVNQSFFRRRILSAYEFTCCVTGLSVRELLVASHIVPWSQDPKNRLNPRNGLCLNALHDRAFDRGLMWVDNTLCVRFSPQLRERRNLDEALEWALSFEGTRLRLPDQFSPDGKLLSQHSSGCRTS